MATRREEIIVGIGGDSKALLKDLNMNRQQVKSWAKGISEEIKSGTIPQAWQAYSKNTSAALKQTEATGKESVSNFSKHSVSMLAKVGTAFLAAFSVQKIIASFRDVAKEIGELDKQFDSSAFMKNRRADQLRGMSNSDRENVVAGNVQTQGWWNGVKDNMAKAAGLIAFGVDTVSTKLTDKGAAGVGLTWTGAAVKAAQRQKEILEGVKAASAEQQAAESSKKTEKEKAEIQKKSREELSKWLKENQFQREVEKFHLEEQLKARQRITAEILKQRSLQSPGVLGYRQEPQAVEETAEELGGVQYPDLYAGLNEYQRRTKASGDRWKQHVGGMTPEAIRRNTMRSSIRDSRQTGNTGPNADVVNKLDKIFAPLEKDGKLPVKVELDK